MSILSPVTICGEDDNGDSFPVRITPAGEMFSTETERETGVFVMLTDSQTTASTYYYGLIDKSDTVNWPHSFSARIDLSVIRVSLDKQSNGTGSFAIGVITRVDGTDADIDFIYNLSFEENDSISANDSLNYSPSQLKCSVSAGELQRIKTSLVSNNVSAINTAGGDLEFNGDTFVPSVGDIVGRLIKTGAGSISFTALVGYHGEETVTSIS